MFEIIVVGLIGLATTSSVMIGAALGLYVPFPQKVLAGVLGFASGSLIAALAIELGFEGAHDLVKHGMPVRTAWLVIAGGFAIGAVVYYAASLYLEQRGAAIRYQSRFQEFAKEKKQQESARMITLLAKCDLLRHLPPEDIEPLLAHVHEQAIAAGEVLFRAGDPGDALYIVADGTVEVLSPADEHVIAELGEGQAFGEMALLSGGPRTASIRARTDVSLLKIDKADFDHLLVEDPYLADAVRRLSHDRAVSNLAKTDINPAMWADLARGSVSQMSRREEHKLLHDTGASSSAGLAIVFGNILDTIPGCLVIGAKFDGLASLSLSLIFGMWLGGVPEAAASAAMLRRADFSNRKIFGLWSTVLVAGVIAAVLGYLFLGADSGAAVFAQAVAGGAILALVCHAMIPEALHKGGSAVVLPIVGGFLFALYLAMAEMVPG
jgi:CRP-like cAMP-binding protein